MSGNGRGNMRPASRSPPFLLIGLLVALCILAFNYWNLSSKNGLLSKQLETAQVDFRSMSDKHLVVEKRAVDLSGQLTQASARLSQLQKESAGKDTRIQELTNQQETLKREQDEVTSHLRQCEEQIEATRQGKQQAEDELQRVKGELEAEKQKAAPACDIIGCKDPIRELISAVTRGVGTLPVITALKQGNIDLSQVAADLLQANAEQPPAGGPQQQQQQPVQAAGQAGDQQQQQQQQGGNQ